MRTPVDDYPAEVGRRLAELRSDGLDFPDAWDRVFAAIKPLDVAGWGTLDGRDPDGLETPLAFLYRHMRAAYVGRDTSHRAPRDVVRAELDHIAQAEGLTITVTKVAALFQVPERLLGGCGCEPLGLDGVRCPGADGRLLCER